MTTLPEVFQQTVARCREAPAIVAPGGRTLTFGDLAQRSDAFAAHLRERGLRKGERVLVALPLTADLYVALAGLWKSGLVAVFPEPALGLRGLLHAVRTARPQALVATGAYRLLRFLPPLWRLDLLRPYEGGTGAPPDLDLAPEDPALVSFTSGTSGAPKAILRSHALLMAQHAAVAPILGTDAAPRDLVAFPVFVLVNLAAGRCSVLPNWNLNRQRHADPDGIRSWIAASGATRLLVPPSICEKLATEGVPEQVTTIFTGGGPVFPDLLLRLRAARPDMRIVVIYGSTEAEPIAEVDVDDIAPVDWEAMESGSGLIAGPPVPGLDLRIADGEIQVAGPHVNRGYMDPAQDVGNKLREGDRIWHRTGDAGWLDDRGRLWLLGRWRPVPSEGPMPFQIEAAARFWPGVRRAALAQLDGGETVLAIEGEADRIDTWCQKARSLGVTRVVRVKAMPLDRRHASKIDEARLRRML